MDNVDKLLTKGLTLEQIYYGARSALLSPDTETENINEAFITMRKLALLGHEEARWIIDVVVDRNNGIWGTANEMAECFLREPESGRSLAFAAELIIGPLNFKQRLLERSANLGYPFGMALLAGFYYNREEQHLTVKWAQKAAEANDAVGLCWLGRCCIPGALKYYERSAQAGHPSAMKICILSYDDPLKCIYWYGKLYALKKYIGGHVYDGCYYELQTFIGNIVNEFNFNTDKFTEFAKYVYALGKIITFDVYDSAWFKKSNIHFTPPMNQAMQLFKEWTTKAKMSTLTWLCIAKYRLKMIIFDEKQNGTSVAFEKNVALIIARLVWDSRNSPENCCK